MSGVVVTISQWHRIHIDCINTGSTHCNSSLFYEIYKLQTLARTKLYKITCQNSDNVDKDGTETTSKSSNWKTEKGAHQLTLKKGMRRIRRGVPRCLRPKQASTINQNNETPWNQKIKTSNICRSHCKLNHKKRPFTGNLVRQNDESDNDREWRPAL